MPEPALIEIVTDAVHAPDVAALAAATFPLACPPHSTAEDIAAFVTSNLDADSFAGHIVAADRDVLVARDGIGGDVIGYCLVVHTAPTHPDVAAVVTRRPVTEVSKMYVAADHHARGRTSPPSHALMDAALRLARERGSVLAWLGVNQENERAQRFYEKMGFRRSGVKTFDLNGSIEHDYIYVQPLD
ncbi:GNAT family N-acetyltransferase [Gordonia sp. PKS22-38]|uniref:GNAT family N-acetyltransferase n=1 Tax=Gordonia prachuapensis TaxID=3115651 RepID=A0ABU7MSE3_9ACTN|nr:GNAT family N-acetyltransferase [Gordonia sp. PKS22-38]